MRILDHSQGRTRFLDLGPGCLNPKTMRTALPKKDRAFALGKSDALGYIRGSSVAEFASAQRFLAGMTAGDLRIGACGFKVACGVETRSFRPPEESARGDGRSRLPRIAGGFASLCRDMACDILPEWEAKRSDIRCYHFWVAYE